MMILTLISCSILAGIDPGTVTGSFSVGGKAISLKHAYAHLHDNAEGLLDRPKELRILLTDREVPQSALHGLVFLPVGDLAQQGKVQGLLFEMDPANPNSMVVTFLLKPEQPGQMLARQTISVTGGGKVFKKWIYNSQRVVGEIDRRDEGSSGLPDFKAMVYSLQFSAPLFHEPAVTADLKGKAAVASPQMKAYSARADALARADFAAVRKLTTERANRRMEPMLAQHGNEMEGMAKQAGAEMKKMASKVVRLVVRGDRAVAIFPGKAASNFAREGGQWKSDD